MHWQQAGNQDKAQRFPMQSIFFKPWNILKRQLKNEETHVLNPICSQVHIKYIRDLKCNNGQQLYSSYVYNYRLILC